ncbi:MAG: hypothetical protein IPK78_06715 [Rhodospirillales bacterium]|nr:hypothetical protein [Rhodospirillales bacterium]
MPHLRLDEGRGKLTEAVQKLTGLDELIELGRFIQGLCHSSRDYLAYKKAELATSKTEFEKQIERARSALSPVDVTVPSFKPSDTNTKDGAMAQFGKMLNDKAAELIATVSADLASDLVLTDPKVQKRIVVALAGAEEDLNGGIASLSTWNLVETIASALPKEARATVRDARAKAAETLETAVAYFQKQKADSKFRLKASGAHWHDENLAGPIENCPLCVSSLKGNPDLQEELEALRSAGEAATRHLQDNVNAIMVALAEALPLNLRRLLGDALPRKPRAEMEKDYRRKFVEAERYAKVLLKFRVLAEATIAAMPDTELADATERVAPLSATANVAERLDKIDLMCRLAEWHEDHCKAWSDWWAKLTPAEGAGDESPSSHLLHLNKSLSEAEPYRIGADAMRLAWSQGRTASAIQKEQAKRQEIANDLAPLKQLSNLAEASAERDH